MGTLNACLDVNEGEVKEEVEIVELDMVAELKDVAEASVVEANVSKVKDKVSRGKVPKSKSKSQFARGSKVSKLQFSKVAVKVVKLTSKQLKDGGYVKGDIKGKGEIKKCKRERVVRAHKSTGNSQNTLVRCYKCKGCRKVAVCKDVVHLWTRGTFRKHFESRELQKVKLH